MVAWHHRLNGHEPEQAPGVGDAQGSLMCCSPRGHRQTRLCNWNELMEPMSVNSVPSFWRQSLGKNTGVGSRSLLQVIFPTQGSNPGLPHWGGCIATHCSGLQAWQSTPAFLPGESPWTAELGGSTPWGHKDSDMTERLSTAHGANKAPWKNQHGNLLTGFPGAWPAK